MDPRIQKLQQNDDFNTLTFTLSGVNVSLANAIRRTILSDIPTVVFKTLPYELNKAKFIANTSRLNNEILKQRLGCVPIHIPDLEIPLENYLLEVKEENLTDTVMRVTTEHFKIKNLSTGEYLTPADKKRIFPPFVPQSGRGEYYIDFVHLRPKITEEIPGEKINFTCEFSIGTAKEDAMYNVVGTCAYGYTQDPEKVEKELAKRVQQWRESGLSAESIEFEAANWRLLDGLRFTLPDSFDFTIQTVGVFTNNELIAKSCSVLVEKLRKLDVLIDTDELQIDPSKNTMNNSYDIILVNEDYTLGKVLEFMLYSKFYEGAKTLTYCGFKKMHPHDNDSIVRIAFHDATDKEGIKIGLKACIVDAVAVFKKIAESFK
jgi:DNA-directed RNA polymerase alpha subunit